MHRGIKLLLSTALLLWSVVGGAAQIIYWPQQALDLAKQRSATIKCVNQLKQIGIAARIWTANNFDQFPPSLQIFTDVAYNGDNFLGDDPSIVYCPADVSCVPPTNWTGVDWAKIDYTLIPQPFWYELNTNIYCTCRIHLNGGQMSGVVLQGDYRSGWPAVVAAPLEQTVAPGSTVHFEVRVAPDALQPVSYHWWRGPLYYTNVVYFTNTNYPAGGYWRTNLVPNVGAPILPGGASSILSLSNVQTNQSDTYCVAISNAMGTTVTFAALHVDPETPSMATNDYWSGVHCLNNLKQIGLLGRLWSFDHNDAMPLTLGEMTNSYGLPMFGWPVMLFCRADHSRSVPPDWAGVNFEDTSYELFPGTNTDSKAIFCRCKVHGYYVEMDGAAISQPRFNSIRGLSNNVVELNLGIFALRTNVLQTSSNMVQWTTLKTYLPTYGDLLFYDTNNLPRRFYRIQLP